MGWLRSSPVGSVGVDPERAEQKLQVVGETQEPGARVAEVAARHGCAAGPCILVLAKTNPCGDISFRRSVPVFLPVQISEAAPQTVVSPYLSGRKIARRFVSPVAIRVIKSSFVTPPRFASVANMEHLAALRGVLDFAFGGITPSQSR